MGKTNFKSLESLSENIKNNVDLLKKGDLSISEIEELTEYVKELYERMIVIRFKAFEGDTEIVEPTEPIEEKVLIQEEIIEEPIVIEKEEVVDDMMMFDFSNEPQETNEPVIEEEAIENIVEEEPEIETPEVPIAKVIQSLGDHVNDDPSLNDNFKSHDNSLANQLSKSAIDDLKSYIGINRKFLYINDLFDGNNDAFNKAVSELNKEQTFQNAFMYLEQLGNDFNWDKSHKSVIKFTEIIERRHSK